MRRGVNKFRVFALKEKINFLEQREPSCLHVWPSRDKTGSSQIRPLVVYFFLAKAKKF